MFKSLRIGQKLVISYIILAALVTAVGVVGLMNLGKVNDMLTLMYEEHVASLGLVSDMQLDTLARERNLYELLMRTGLDEKKALEVRMDARETKFHASYDKLSKVNLQGESIAIFKTLMPSWEAYKKLNATIIDLSTAGQNIEALDFLTKQVRPAY